MTIVAPADAEEMTRAMDATLAEPGPVYVRIAKGNEPVITRPEDGFAIGRAIRCARVAMWRSFRPVR